jgi:hypothetical protein
VPAPRVSGSGTSVGATKHSPLSDSGTALHGCTSSQGAYSLTAAVSVASTEPGLPPQYAFFSLLGSHDTGPLVCYLVSFLLLIIAFGPWLYEIFSVKSRSFSIARIVSDLVCLHADQTDGQRLRLDSSFLVAY